MSFSVNKICYVMLSVNKACWLFYLLLLLRIVMIMIMIMNLYSAKSIEEYSKALYIKLKKLNVVSLALVHTNLFS